MVLHKTKNKILQTQDLNNLATPEDMAQSLRECYAHPLKEMLRRKKAAEEEEHYKNICFWQAVEDILSPAKNFIN